MNTRRVLVLGAGGFIGRHLAERLANDGHEVIAATRKVVEFAHPRIRNVVSTFDDASHFAPLLAQCGAVVHAASSSTPGSDATRPQIDGNLRTTLALLEALQDASTRRLFYLSSGGTLYGNRDEPAREIDPLCPRSYHGAGKAAAEQFIHAWAVQYDGSAIVLRPSNVYGPGQPARAGFGIIPAAFDCVLHSRPLMVWGDGGALRDYLYIDDLVSLSVTALASPPATGMSTFNVASGVAITLDELLNRIDAVTGKPLERLHRPARTADVRSICLDANAARATFGWTPATPFDAGLQYAWQWFCDQARV